MTSGSDPEPEADLFRRSMRELGVKRSRKGDSGMTPARRPGEPDSAPRRRVAGPGTTRIPAAIDRTDPDGPVLFARSGVSSTRLRQLRRGNIAIEESLDLHGLRSGDAGKAMEGFVSECLELGLGCVLLIHGKGRGSEVAGGVLKPLAIHWLRQQAAVLAFCEALPGDGGSGALYLLLDKT